MLSMQSMMNFLRIVVVAPFNIADVILLVLVLIWVVLLRGVSPWLRGVPVWMSLLSGLSGVLIGLMLVGRQPI